MLNRYPAYFIYVDGIKTWYFAPVARTQGPYLTQKEVSAIIDIAQDGTLAGIELIDLPAAPLPVGKPLPSFRSQIFAYKREDGELVWAKSTSPEATRFEVIIISPIYLSLDTLSLVEAKRLEAALRRVFETGVRIGALQPLFADPSATFG